MIQESWVLVGKTIVILLPDVGSQQIIQGGDLPAPGQFQSHLQPLGVLAEHGVDDANEGLITIEYAVATSQQIAFQPTLTLMLAEHGVQNATGRR